MVDLLERLDVLLEQEVSGYRTQDYLAPDFQRRIALASNSANLTPLSSSLSCASASSNSGINEVWRERICKWSYQVVDHFDLSREVVTISIHYLDRYLSTRTVTKKVFQLVAMTTLYIAIKLYEHGTLSMKSMIDLSRGFFTVEQMAEMEVDILRSLSWRVHPPTSYCFAQHILFLLPYTSVSSEVRYEILELARFLSELSVFDYFFVLHRPSSVGLASILSAMHAIPSVPYSAIEDLKAELTRVPDLDPEKSAVKECCDRLEMLYTQGGYSRPTFTGGGIRVETTSPVCVSQHGVDSHGLHHKRCFDQEFLSTQK